MLINKEKIFVSTIIYIHNKQDIIYSFLTDVNDILFQNFERYEIICVNDASSDYTIQEVQRFTSDLTNCEVSILNMGYYQGVELSMVAGVDFSIGDFVFEFDSVIMDFNLELIMDVYRLSMTGYDIVSASPDLKKRRYSRLFYNIFNKFSENQYPLKTETFRILSRRAINRIHGASVSIPYRKAAYSNCGLNMETIFYHNKQTTLKEKPIERNKNIDIALEAIIMYTDLAYKCTIIFSIIMILIALLIGSYTLVIYCKGNPVAGWTTTMLFLACAFGGLFIIQTILIKYISLILKTVFNKKKYIVESVIKLGNHQ